MQNHAVQNTEPQGKSAAHELFEKKSSSEGVQIIDNRPEAIAQRKLQEIANNSKQVKQLQALQTMAYHHTQQHTPVANKTGLPDHLKSGIENVSGYSMDDVKVHYNSDKPAQLNAHAYAQGADIHIASGQEKHLPHEAWHVVQQKEGRVKTTLQMKDQININNEDSLEKEADQMGALALKTGLNTSNDTSSFSNSPLQKKNKSENTFSLKKNSAIAGTGIIQRVISARNAFVAAEYVITNHRKDLNYEWTDPNLILDTSFHKKNYDVIIKALQVLTHPQTGENVDLVVSYINTIFKRNTPATPDDPDKKYAKRIKSENPAAGAATATTAEVSLNTPVTFNGTDYTTRNALVDAIEEIVGDKININQAINRMDSNSNVSANTGISRTTGGKADAETQSLRSALHCSFGMAENGCTIFFISSGDNNTIIGLGHHVSNDSKKYRIKWAAPGYPTGRFDLP